MKKLTPTIIIVLFLLSLFPVQSNAQETKSVSLYPSADATVVDISGTNYGSEATLKCQNDAATFATFLIKFDLSTIPSNATVQSATLSLNLNDTNGSTVTLNAYKVTSTWSETSVSGSSKPGIDLGVVYGAQSVGGSLGKITFSQDFSDLVENWLSNPALNQGLYFESTKSADYEHVFGSKESSIKPTLAMTYSVPDENPPVISDISTSFLTQTSVIIEWKTDEEATSFVEYGENLSYGKIAGSGEYTSNHSVLLSELESNTKYHFKVTSEDAYGNKSESADTTFKTKAKKDPQEEAKTEENVSDEIYPPSGLKIVTGVEDEKYYAELGWQHSVTEEIDGYRIYRSEEDRTSYVFLTEVGNDKTSYKDFEVEDGKTYFYVLRTVKGELESKDSNEEVITIYGPDGQPKEKDFSFWKGFTIVNLTLWPVLAIAYVLYKRKRQGKNLRFRGVGNKEIRK
ncbi:MAG: DNRLRE domain-containing protein [Candidatus Dojkabacteria bacterium]|nr:DNRLRE domain-containing protein [Candidatus Dojkabacteria bacterium]